MLMRAPGVNVMPLGVSEPMKLMPFSASSMACMILSLSAGSCAAWKSLNVLTVSLPPKAVW
ncbi:hypothetical protein D3C87_2144900 [compost metagenome]